jgi:HAD superfamily hydrolase (TIGR01509 family)
VQLVKEVRGIIFDCDGVLFDSRGVNERYYNAVLAELGLGPMSRDQVEFVHMHHVAASIAHIVPSDRLQDAEKVRQQLDYRRFVPFMQPAPGLGQLLETCRNLGLFLAVNTNRTDTMDLVLRHFSLTDVFDPVVTASAVTRPKPHPESVHRILNSWGLPPEQAAFIGDSALDQQAAQAGGVRFWAFGPSDLDCRMRILHFEHLRRLLVRASGRQ